MLRNWWSLILTTIDLNFEVDHERDVLRHSTANESPLIGDAPVGGELDVCEEVLSVVGGHSNGAGVDVLSEPDLAGD